MRLSRIPMNRKMGRLASAVSLALLSLGFGSGCSSTNPLDIKSWIDPSELAGRTRKDTLVVKILNQVDPSVEEPNRDFVTAQPPKQEDLVVNASDYVISKNDQLSVEISDLNGPGTQTVKTTRVSESGNISLPYVGQIKGEGLTEYELEQAIIKAYKDAKIIERAQVSVAVNEARGRAISILGAVNQPGQYALIDPDFRVLDALTLARDATSTLLTDLYIIRRTDLSRPSAKKPAEGAVPESPAVPPTSAPVPKPAGGGVDDIKPRSSIEDSRPSRHVAMVNPSSPRAASLKGRMLPPLTSTGSQGNLPLLLADTAPTPGGTADDKGRFVIIDGKKVYIGGDSAVPSPTPEPTPAPTPAPAPAPVPADVTPPAPTPTPAVAPTPAGVPTPPLVATPVPVAPGSMEPVVPAGTFGGFRDLSAPDNVRIIHIPLDRLRSGELQYNIVIKPKDMIIVQNLPIGEYYMGGHISQPGAYTLTQRHITLKQAVIAAHMLDQLAIPERTDIVRRIGPDKEVFVRVNLAKIFEGEAPDIFLKPDDQVTVGTNFVAPFIAAVRGAFRFTYGFGFLYDRNFAAEQNNRTTTR